MAIRLVGLMLVRNEAWILGASARAALRFCDALAVMDHGSEDQTLSLIWDLQAVYGADRVIYGTTGGPDCGWLEMDLRQQLLEQGRRIGGTHWALIDADEILTANLVPLVREWCESVGPGEALEVPMLAAGPGLYQHRDDDSVWSRAWLSFLVGDRPDLAWRPAGDGYHHHHRLPYGVSPRPWRRGESKADGGVLHLQWASRRRIVAKHVWYRMLETIRYPGRMTADQLNEKYDAALSVGRHVDTPPEWWDGVDRFRIDLEAEPWYEFACREMWRAHGPEKFAGLNLHGLIRDAESPAKPA